MSVIRKELDTKGYSLALGLDLPIEERARALGEEFAREWDTLEPDKYLQGGARFRERRYQRFYYHPQNPIFQPLRHRPYFQSATANSYAGGIHREVAPLTPSSLRNPMLKALLEFNFAQFPMAPDDERLGLPWEVACHQFRIIGTSNEVGEPTPEGIHRDEIDFGAIHLISRSNVAGGNSRVYDNEKNLIAEFQLQSHLDTLFWADREVLHSVTPISPVDPSARAVRDILILGYRCVPELLESD